MDAFELVIIHELQTDLRSTAPKHCPEVFCRLSKKAFGARFRDHVELWGTGYVALASRRSLLVYKDDALFGAKNGTADRSAGEQKRFVEKRNRKNRHFVADRIPKPESIPISARKIHWPTIITKKCGGLLAEKAPPLAVRI